jgi:hypothetical protein
MSRRIRSRKAGSDHNLAHESKFGKLLFVEFLHRKNLTHAEFGYLLACAGSNGSQHDFPPTFAAA